MSNDHLHPVFKNIIEKLETQRLLIEGIKLKQKREELNRELKIFDNVRLVRRAETIANGGDHDKTKTNSL